MSHSPDAPESFEILELSQGIIWIPPHTRMGPVGRAVTIKGYFRKRNGGRFDIDNEPEPTRSYGDVKPKPSPVPLIKIVRDDPFRKDPTKVAGYLPTLPLGDRWVNNTTSWDRVTPNGTTKLSVPILEEDKSAKALLKFRRQRKALLAHIAERGIELTEEERLRIVALDISAQRSPTASFNLLEKLVDLIAKRVKPNAVHHIDLSSSRTEPSPPKGPTRAELRAALASGTPSAYHQ